MRKEINPMTNIRLDPITLRELASLLRSSAPHPIIDDWISSPIEVEYGGLGEMLDDLATDAESQPATFSDFVRACEVSNLGQPEVRVFDVHHWGLAFPLGHNVMLFSSGDTEPLGCTVIPNGDWDLRVHCETPAALTEALNALAKDAP